MRQQEATREEAIISPSLRVEMVMVAKTNSLQALEKATRETSARLLSKKKRTSTSSKKVTEEKKENWIKISRTS